MDAEHYRLARENETLRRRVAELERQVRELRLAIADLEIERDAIVSGGDNVRFGR